MNERLDGMYTIYDSVSEIFNRPFTDINDGSAVRSFTQSIEKSYNKNDYFLYKIGEFSPDSGIVSGYDIPKKIYSGLDIKSINKVEGE